MTACQRSIGRAAAAVFLLFAAALGVTRAEASIPRAGDVERGVRASDTNADRMPALAGTLTAPAEAPRPAFPLGATLPPPRLGPSLPLFAAVPELALFPLFTPEPAPGAGRNSRYVTEDELGNVTHLTDQSGAVVERYQYEGYGKFRIFDPANSPRTVSSFGWNRLFQGREYLGIVDAYDFRARVLWPELGRFGQEDPLGTTDSANRYQALGGAWLLFADPLGLEVTEDEVGLGMFPEPRKPTLVGAGPFNIVTGALAHKIWQKWIQQNRSVEMGALNVRAFYDRACSTIAERVGRTAEKHANRRPDAARIEMDPARTVTVWELKPSSYDPEGSRAAITEGLPGGVNRAAGGFNLRLALAQIQLGRYLTALAPAQKGDSGQLNSPYPGDDLSGAGVVPGPTKGSSYIVYAYANPAASAYDTRGLVFYYLLSNGRESEEEALERSRQRAMDDVSKALARALADMLGPVPAPGGFPLPVPVR